MKIEMVDMDQQHNLLNKIIKASNIIHKEYIKGSTNYIIVGEPQSTILYDLFKKEERINKFKKILNGKS